MKRKAKIGLGVLGVLVAIQLVPVDRSNPPVQQEIAAPPAVMAVLERSCYDCHSNKTTWPWYSYVAPASWLVAHDVEEGRHELNFTAWNQYPPDKRAKKIHEVGEEVGEGKMPLRQYLLLHSDAKLSEDDRRLLLDWARAEGRGDD